MPLSLCGECYRKVVTNRLCVKGCDYYFNFGRMILRVFKISVLLLILHQIAAAQSVIGSWGDHLSYMHPLRLGETGNKLVAATSAAIFTVDLRDKSIERISKINGLAEAGITAMEADPVSGKTIVAYRSSNLDLLTAEGIINLDAIKRSAISTDKYIYDIHIGNNLAYLSSDFGIVVIDLSKNEIKESLIIGSNGSKVKVSQVAVNDKFIFAATEEGLKKAAISSGNLNDYGNWQQVTGPWRSGAVNGVNVLGNDIIIRQGDSLFAGQDSSWKLLYRTDLHILNVNVSMNRLVICEKKAGSAARVVSLRGDGSPEKIYQQTEIISPEEALIMDNEIWIADSVSGLLQSAGNRFNTIRLNSPYSEASGEMLFAGNSLWVTPGLQSAGYQNSFSLNGFFRYTEQAWQNYLPSGFAVLDSLYDLLTIAVSNKDHSLWLGSLGGGLLRFQPGETPVVYKQQSGISTSVFHSGQYRVAGLAFDREDHLWIANYGAAESLVLRKPDGSWKKFRPPFVLNGNAVAQVLIDDFNQKWIVSPEGNGLLLFNHGQSLDNTGDDQWKFFRVGKGNGNLPDNNVLSIAKDKSGFIWVGTSKGIGIIPCAGQAFSSTTCEAVMPVVQQDNFGGYLFSNEQVQAIAVNAADQKWIGTRNGAWLISSDGEKTLQHFTEENSPLASNDIRKIAIDPKTGDVFFATAKGICSFRGNAVEGSELSQSLLIYPNPVPPGYTGSIAVRGLVTNSIVKITELDGRLVYQTRALGGQAIWNGRDYRGRAVSSGVYLVIVSDDTRKQKATGKIVFISR